MLHGLSACCFKSCSVVLEYTMVKKIDIQLHAVLNILPSLFIDSLHPGLVLNSRDIDCDIDVAFVWCLHRQSSE